MSTVEDNEADFLEIQEARNVIKEKILHTLTIWPKLSPSMLQVGIGTSVSPKMWHPVLKRLEADGLVVREELAAKSHIGRDQIYTILRLGPKPTQTADVRETIAA